MPRPSPFEYDVSVSADKARRRPRRGMSGAVDGATKQCEHPSCDKPGAYRAPFAPDALDRYRWFCLDHVRAYNAAWNYFENYSNEDFEAYLERSRLWDRPTWSFRDAAKAAGGAHHPHGEGRAWERHGFGDPFEVLGGNATINPGGAEAAKPAKRRFPPHIRRALDVLGARGDESRAELRRLYRDLVKDLHPDMNGGDRREEERLRRVLWAWDQIKDASAFRG